MNLDNSNIPKEISVLTAKLQKLYEVLYKELNNEVEHIIKNKISDINCIEKIYESLLNIPTDKAYKLLIKFSIYTERIEPQITLEYLKLYHELYFEKETVEQIKIKKQSK